MARQAWRGGARLGVARSGAVRQGRAGVAWQATHGMSRSGLIRLGGSWWGLAGRPGCGTLWLGLARRGSAWQSGQGSSRQRALGLGAAGLGAAGGAC